jgi:hypothetical protein
MRSVDERLSLRSIWEVVREDFVLWPRVIASPLAIGSELSDDAAGTEAGTS